MKQSNAMNAIRFSFMFHQYNGGKIEDYDPGYILEKWRSHFGDLEPMEISKRRHEDLRRYPAIAKWTERWGEASYTAMSKYLSILVDINLLPMRVVIRPSDISQATNIPSGLIEIIEASTEGFAEADLPEYRGLHANLEESMKRWLEEDECKQDLEQANRRLAIAKLIR